MTGSTPGKPHSLAPVRRAAEWGLFGSSLLLILGVAGLLVYEGLQADLEAIPVRIVVDAVQPLPPGQDIAETAVVPVHVHNVGERTLGQLTLHFRRDDLEWEVVLEYLQPRDKQTVFVPLAGLEQALEVTALSYQLE